MHRLPILLTSGQPPSTVAAEPNRKEVSVLRPLSGMLLRQLSREDEDGQTLVEYGLIMALIVLVVFIAVVLLGGIVSGFYFEFGDTVQDVT